MGRKSSKSQPAAASNEIPGCFNGIWNAAPEVDDSPVLARKSLSERKFSEGFEAPRNSLDIASAMFENVRFQSSSAAVPSDEIPFGYEFALRKSLSDRAPPRVSISNTGAQSMENSSSRCRSPSVIARLMGLDTLPPAENDKKSSAAAVPASVKQQPQSSATDLQAWRLLSERRDFLSSRSSREHKEEPQQQQGRCLTRQLSSSRVTSDEFLLFDVLPFRDHPQEKQLEKLKQDFQAQRQLEDNHRRLIQLQKANANVNVKVPATSSVDKRQPESKESMLEAIQFLQSNKEFLVKFLREPNSVFSKHIYDLQALAAREGAAEISRGSLNKAGKVTPPQQSQSNIGFSRKLLESKKESQKITRKEEAIQKPQRKENASQDKIILLKSNSLRKQQTPPRETEDPGLRRCRSFREAETSVDPKELARQIAREVRENIRSTTEGGEGSEPSSRRYSKDYRVSSSQPNSPRAKSNVSSKEGRKQLMEKLKITQGNQSDDESSKGRELMIHIELTKQKDVVQEHKPKKGAGKLLKLFSREPSSPVLKTSSDHSPRLLVRSKSVPSFVEESPKKQETPEAALDRTHSCKQSSGSRCPASSESTVSKGKFSSLKSSLLGKKKSRAAAGSPPDSRRETEHSVSGGYEDHYTRTFRETEAQLATSYASDTNKFVFESQSPRFLSVNINDDTSSDIHTEKSEQPSPVSVLERGFIEESPSPVSFEDVSSDLQELQMRLERLKLDESGRIEDVRRRGIETENSPRPLLDSPDNVYVSKLIHASGFSNSISSLFNWHSPSCPIDPYLFAKLESEYSTSAAGLNPSPTIRHGHRKVKIGRRLKQIERRPETLHRQMVFDVVNEVLSRKYQHLWNDQPWHEIGKQGIRAVACSGRHLVWEVEREMEQYRHEYDHRGEYPLENLVERDVKRGSGQQWMETREELRKITSQVETDIFNGLVEELALGLASCSL